MDNLQSIKKASHLTVTGIKDGGVNMATTSFTKNFCVSAGKSAEFVTHMTKNTKQVLPKGFESKYEHPNHHREALQRIFGK